MRKLVRVFLITFVVLIVVLLYLLAWQHNVKTIPEQMSENIYQHMTMTE